MHFTDTFIKKPVLATVISLFILALGLRAIVNLPILQYPFTQKAVITVSTSYFGADPEIIAGFITTPLEKSLAQASGIDYMTSTSTQGKSTINLNLLLNYDPDKAVADVNTKVNAVLNQLPADSQQPEITIVPGETIDAMYLGFYSEILPENKITDYLLRNVQPKLQSINGVQNAEILGPRMFAMRAWLDPQKLAGYGLTAENVASKLGTNDFISAVGRTKGQMITQNLTAATGLSSAEEFSNLIIKSENGANIRLGDVSTVSLGAENYDTAVKFDGKAAVYIGIKVQPSANLLTVLDEIKAMFPNIQKELPEGLDSNIVYDTSAYVNSSIEEVIKTLFEALAIVTIVIFLFLGSFRSVAVPIIAMPISLVGTFFCMMLLGYSINLLTLLALVLAIGLVVDDAIIIVENVHRHIENGVAPLKASLQGAGELIGPVIATTAVLIAVYLPIGFMGGLTGALFTEFAFTLASAVTVSSIVALTLSPMMCSKFLKPASSNHSKLAKTIDAIFVKVDSKYRELLDLSLNNLSVVIVFAVIILASNYFLFATAQSELAPQEDQGVVLAQVETSANSTLEQTQLWTTAIDKIFLEFPETWHTFMIDGSPVLNKAIGGMVLTPWDERTTTSNEIQPVLQQKLDNIAGAKIAAFQLPSLPGGGSGLPIQFVIQTTRNFNELNTVTQSIVAEARKAGIFMFIDPDLKINKQQSTVMINRDKAAQFGLTMKDVGNALGWSLSENYVNYFDYMGRSYKVIPLVSQVNRLNNTELLDYYMNTADGATIPFSTLISLKESVVPQSLNHFQQLNSATISAVAFPGVTMGDSLAVLKEIAEAKMPEGYSIDYAAQSRQFIQEGSALVATFFFALIIIFLSLAAQFESFRDPLIILVSVPMSICGAMIFVSMGIGGATINIYTQVGLVTLIGLISKNGILIVQFANDLQLEGRNKRDAIMEASEIRLRPILMTTFSMIFGVIPLITATGAGALSRYNIGLVIATGLAIGTLFTLFVVPAVYLIIAEDKSKKAIEDAELSPA